LEHKRLTAKFIMKLKVLICKNPHVDVPPLNTKYLNEGLLIYFKHGCLFCRARPWPPFLFPPWPHPGGTGQRGFGLDLARQHSSAQPVIYRTVQLRRAALIDAAYTREDPACCRQYLARYYRFSTVQKHSRKCVIDGW